MISVLTTDGDSAEEKLVPLTKRSPSPIEASTPTEADDGSHGDNDSEITRNDQPDMMGEECYYRSVMRSDSESIIHCIRAF